jgi:hypothetical protein
MSSKDLRKGARGNAVRALQQALVAAGYPLPEHGVDGDLGNETFAAAAAWVYGQGPLCSSGGIAGGDVIPAAVVAAIVDGRDHATVACGIKRAGAWAGRSALVKPGKYADRAAKLGLTDVSLFVTGLENKSFKLLRPQRDIIKAICEFQARDIDVHLSTWVRPDRAFLAALAEQLVPLCDGGVGLDLDTEGAWRTRSRHDWDGLAVYLFEQLEERGFAGTGGPVGVNDYASLQPCTRPLIELADVIRPQLYSVAYVKHGRNRGPDGKAWTTPSSIYWPGKTQRYGMREGLWGGVREGKRLEAGLASYKQPVRGWSTKRAMFACWDAVEKLGAEAVWWWSLWHMTGDIGRVVKKLTARISR